jgi:uncharacterized membrane protein
VFHNQIFSKNKKKEQSYPEKIKFLSYCVVIIVPSIVSVYIFKFAHLGLSNEQEVWGQFGDYIGGVLNPIFAFFAFIALMITIKLQNEALITSKEELKLSREELEKSRIAQEAQSESLKLQNHATKLQMFENTFFQLISVFIELKRNITSNKKERVNGLVGKEFKSDSVIITLNSIETITSFVKEINDKYLGNYNDFNKDYEAITGSYFGQVYQIIKFIETSKINKKEKYSDIFRAQFTKNELEFLFYHCLGTIGRRKFKKLVEDYAFFEHIILNENIEKQLLEYDIKAFGKNENILKKYDELKKVNFS